LQCEISSAKLFVSFAIAANIKIDWRVIKLASISNLYVFEGRI
jgi:hypothetical protein